MRPIDADALRVWLTTGFRTNCDDCANTDCLDCVIGEALDNAPTIDAEPVKHGSWILGHVPAGMCTPGGNRPWICSECGAVKSWRMDKPEDNYCPSCGAKMENI